MRVDCSDLYTFDIGAVNDKRLCCLQGLFSKASIAPDDVIFYARLYTHMFITKQQIFIGNLKNLKTVKET